MSENPEDHPYDRGYWDRVNGKSKRPAREATTRARLEYANGWNTADKELRQEPRKLAERCSDETLRVMSGQPQVSKTGLKPCPFCGAAAEYDGRTFVHSISCSNERCLVRPHVGIFWAEKFRLDRSRGNNFVHGTKSDVVRIWNDDPEGENA